MYKFQIPNFHHAECPSEVKEKNKVRRGLQFQIFQFQICLVSLKAKNLFHSCTPAAL